MYMYILCVYTYIYMYACIRIAQVYTCVDVDSIRQIVETFFQRSRLTFAVLQIQVREKRGTDHRDERIDVTSRGTSKRRRGGTLRSVRASEIGPSYLGFGHADTSAQRKSRYRYTGYAIGIPKCWSRFRPFRDFLHRRRLHLLRTYIGQMRPQSL